MDGNRWAAVNSIFQQLHRKDAGHAEQSTLTSAWHQLPAANFAHQGLASLFPPWNHVDFVEGLATALTPVAFVETVMVKSYENLVDSDTTVDGNTGIVAAARLQSLIDCRDYSREMLMMEVQLAAICDAVKSTVPQEMWGEIVEKLDELEEQHFGGARCRHGLLR